MMFCLLQMIFCIFTDSRHEKKLEELSFVFLTTIFLILPVTLIKCDMKSTTLEHTLCLWFLKFWIGDVSSDTVARVNRRESSANHLRNGTKIKAFNFNNLKQIEKELDMCRLHEHIETWKLSLNFMLLLGNKNKSFLD